MKKIFFITVATFMRQEPAFETVLSEKQYEETRIKRN